MKLNLKGLFRWVFRELLNSRSGSLWTIYSNQIISKDVWVYDNALTPFPGSTVLTSLAHELAHARDRIQGTIKESVWIPGGYGRKDVPYAEIYAVHIENLIRKEHNLELRTHYIFNKNGNHTGILIENGHSIYYDINGKHKNNFKPINQKMRYKY